MEMSIEALGASCERWLDCSEYRRPDVVRRNYTHFRRALAMAQACAARGQYEQAAVHAAILVSFAVEFHCGVFASPELERLLEEIGRRLSPPRQPAHRSPPATVRRVLHVCGHVRPVGGHSNFITRWVREDQSRSSSLALTDQTWREIPPGLDRAIRKGGGRIHHIKARPGGYRGWISGLAEAAEEADVIVVHAVGPGILPWLAFTQIRQTIPIILVDHVDQLFIAGAAASTLCVSLRQCGMEIARLRRSVDPDRQLLMPILVNPGRRVRSNAEAKRLLGLPPDCVVLLSVARWEKYQTVNGVTYADAHLGLLLRYPELRLLVVGSGEREDWRPVISKTGGRLICLPEKADVRPYFEAGDIFIDTFPLCSCTSHLEAATYGLPLVTLFPFNDRCAILGADLGESTTALYRARSHQDYVRYLSLLVENEAYRTEVGRRTRDDIIRRHASADWQPRLEQLYSKALRTPPPVLELDSECPAVFGEPDELIPALFSQGDGGARLERELLAVKPLWKRVMYAVREMSAGEPAASVLRPVLKSILPEWLIWRLRYRRRF